MKYTYQPVGVCSRLFEFEIEENKIKSLKVTGGCNGNLQGISSIVKDMDIDHVIETFEGINCNGKGTSCPDQIARALKEYKSK